MATIIIETSKYKQRMKNEVLQRLKLKLRNINLPVIYFLCEAFVFPLSPPAHNLYGL